MRRLTYPLTALLLAGCGTDLSGPSSSLFACVFGDARTLLVGEVVTFDGAGNRSLCLTTRDTGATFAYVPFFAVSPPQTEGSTAGVAVEVLGAGVVSGVSAGDAPPPGMPAPSGARLGLADAVDGMPPLRLGGEVHRRLREREIAELEPKIRSAAAGRGARAVTPAPAIAGLPSVGDLMEVNVALSCTRRQMRTGRIVRISERLILLADVANPANGFTDADYQSFAVSFDQVVYPMATRHFGTPSDIDGNDRVIVFFTSAVNALTPAGSSSFTAAAFWSGDLFPPIATPRLEACPDGNHAELFYMAVPDPTGSAGPQVSASWLRDRAVQVMGHEYQHLLNAARRLYVNGASTFERTWLNEGLSHIAEELLFFEVSGLASGSNITLAALQSTSGGVAAFNRYMGSNFHNLTRYLEQPQTGSLMGPDNFMTRGAAWSFLRYGADRSGEGDESVFFRLVNSQTSGIENLDEVLAARALEWMHDWSVSLYADDHVPGLDSRYTQPSWNFRDLYTSTGQQYPLAPVELHAGALRQLSLLPGGTAHLTFGVPTDGRAAIHVEADGSTPPRTLRGSFLRIR